MKIEFELPDNYKNDKLVLCPTNNPSPIIYMNLYEEGDVWLKIQGCESCFKENRMKCCGNCPMSLNDTGECRLHIDNNREDKPFYCIIKPFPNTCMSFCNLQYKCISGSKKGKIRKVNSIRDEFID